MPNPGIEELQNREKFELLAELSHDQVKEFVIAQLSDDGKIVRSFMIYQLIMIFIGIIFLTRSVALLLHGNTTQILISLATLLFCFTFLIIIHELLHGLALKFTGAKKINYGGYLRKFVFYAEADSHILNRRQFAILALTPLVVIKLLTVAGIVIFWHHPTIYFFVLVMSTHSLFCAGDVALLSLFYKNMKDEIFTYDVKAEKTSYFYRRI